MSGDIGHLQRLTEQQVASRLSSYCEDGHFGASLRRLWDDAGPVIDAASHSHFGEDIGATISPSRSTRRGCARSPSKA